MNISGENYTLTYENGVVDISGRLSIMPEEYDDIEVFFKKIIESAPLELTLDFRNLEYLNSSGIKTICVNLILGAADIKGHRMKILCSNHFTWQRETVPTFEGLMDNMEIMFE
jgi:hypothetical protein